MKHSGCHCFVIYICRDLVSVVCDKSQYLCLFLFRRELTYQDKIIIITKTSLYTQRTHFICQHNKQREFPLFSLLQAFCFLFWQEATMLQSPGEESPHPANEQFRVTYKNKSKKRDCHCTHLIPDSLVPCKQIILDF